MGFAHASPNVRLRPRDVRQYTSIENWSRFETTVLKNDRLFSVVELFRAQNFVLQRITALAERWDNAPVPADQQVRPVPNRSPRGAAAPVRLPVL